MSNKTWFVPEFDKAENGYHLIAQIEFLLDGFRVQVTPTTNGDVVWAKRVADCMNAMEGIGDPAFFMELAKKTKVRHVAEMLDALKLAQSSLCVDGYERERVYKIVSDVIAKVEGKKV